MEMKKFNSILNTFFVLLFSESIINFFLLHSYNLIHYIYTSNKNVCCLQPGNWALFDIPAQNISDMREEHILDSDFYEDN